jgi:hypothetical protein
MKIVFLGNFLVDYTSETHWANTLENLGHSVERIQEARNSTEYILSECLGADMFIWVHTHSFVNRGSITMQQLLNKLERAGIPTVAYHLDLYMGLERWHDYENHDYFKIKHFFTVDKLMADWLNKNTNTKGYYLPAGVYKKECYLPELVNPINDIVFTGSGIYHKEWGYRAELINWLKNNYGSSFKHYGAGGLTNIRGGLLNRVYNDTKITIGDTLCINFKYPYYFSDRVFEVMGRGGFIIHPHIKGLDTLFKDKEHLVFYNYGDFKQLKGLINYYLTHDNEREKIRLAGHKLVANEHTYNNRWQTIIDTVIKNE